MNIEEWTGYEVSEVVLEEAANWIAQLDSNSLDENQQVAFYTWLQANPSHQHAYLEMSELWAKSSCIKSMEHMIEKSKVVPFSSSMSGATTQSDIPQPIVARSAWAYSLAIGLIFVGMCLPIIQYLVL